MTKIKINRIPSPGQARRRIALLGVLLIAVFLLSFLLGRYRVTVSEVIRILFSHLGGEKTWSEQAEAAVLRIRLPRILLACLVGAALSSAGCAYQSVFRNPMAAPDILGASSGACFGAALAILCGLPAAGITLLAFFFGMLTVGLVCLIGKKVKGSRTVGLLLAGIMISSLFSAGTSFIKLVADPSNQLPAITYWLMGSLSGVKLGELRFAVVPMALAMLPLLLLRWRVNLLSLGEEEAHAMGVRTDRLRFAVILCATLLTAAAVSVSGMIGWVGLVIPHLCRRLVGSNTRFLLPAGALMGASFLLIVDNVSRNLLAVEIPIGILTAFIGAPFFILLLTGKEVRL